MSRRIAAIPFALFCWPVALLAQPAITAVVNGASFETGVVRGSIVSLFGSNLADVHRTRQEFTPADNWRGPR